MIILFVCFLGFRAVCPLEYAWGHGAFAYLLIIQRQCWVSPTRCLRNVYRPREWGVKRSFCKSKHSCELWKNRYEIKALVLPQCTHSTGNSLSQYIVSKSNAGTLPSPGLNFHRLMPHSDSVQLKPLGMKFDLSGGDPATVAEVSTHAGKDRDGWSISPTNSLEHRENAGSREATPWRCDQHVFSIYWIST